MMSVRRIVAIFAGLSLLIGSTVVAGPAPAVAAEWPPRKPAPPDLVDTSAVPVKPLPASEVETAATNRPAPALAWPTAGTAEVAVPASGDHARAGGLPVWVGPASDAAAGKAAGAVPAAVRVEVADRAAAAGQGVDGLLLRVTPDEGSGPGRVSLGVDYAAFRDVHGGDWAARLRLVELPATGQGPARPLATHNDLAAGRVTADVDVGRAVSSFALTAAPGGETGDYRATSLAPSGTWSVSTQSGTFTYDYPLKVPAVPGGLQPELALAYSSASADGRTAATNNQPSWVGEGWALWPGAIERGYKSCFDDNTVAAQKTGDLCWATDNATLSLDGQSQPLVQVEPGGDVWRPKRDNGSRVERLTGADNGDEGGDEGAGEHWKVTTVDGTQYFFGRSTTSAWTVPVFGNDGGEPCKRTTFDASWCWQGWRWNLDRVVDTHGNVITYAYTPEINHYARNLDGAKGTRYVRGGVLDRVEYGAREGQQPSARVVFNSPERGGPDVPTDQACGAGQNCGTRFSPTFWSTKRLGSVTTQVWDGTAWRDVDRWTLAHLYPANQDATTPSLWLQGITHAGLAATPNISLPQVTFDGTQLANRVNSDADGMLPLFKWRIHRISNESGGWTVVNYAEPDCRPSAMPGPPAFNERRCFPVRWAEGDDAPRDDWMQKYVVASVANEDRVGGQPTETTSYEYLGGAAWRYDDNQLTPTERRTWSQYRGYEQVVVRHGDPSKVTPSATRYLYFRGMHGDHRPDRPREEEVVDSQGNAKRDDEHLAGFLREEVTFDGAGGPVLTSAIHDPWQHGPNATQGPLKSYVVATGKTVTRTALREDDGDIRGWRTAETRTEFNEQALPTTVSDLGDVSTITDDRCTTTTYARNTTKWLLMLPSEVRVDAVACTATPTYPRDAISAVRTSYDGGAHGASPSAGDATRVQQLKEYRDGVPKWVTTTSTFDAHGRPQDSFDALNRKTSTRYAPASGLPASMTVTDPIGNATITSFDPRLGEPTRITDPNQRRIDLTYDALGRLTGVWLPGRHKDAGAGPNQRYAYEVRADGPSWVSSQTLKANNNYLTSYELYDGLLRPRQTQRLGPGANGTTVRVLTDTLYDSRGLTVQENGPYSDTGTPGTELALVADGDVPAMTRTTFDRTERPTESALWSKGDELWRTTTKYLGDHVKITPPAGGTPVATYSDARDQVTEVRQFSAATPAGDHQTTSYTYTGGGELATMTDAAGNTWRYTYDLMGNEIVSDDPDKGVTTTIYDDTGKPVTSVDARGITVAYRHDALGRKVEERLDSLDGDRLATWTYDTILEGQLTSSTRYSGTDAYTTEVTGYDEAYRPTGKRLTLPASQAPLDGPYTTSMTYKPDGSPATVTMPSLPNIAEETITYSYNNLGLPFAMSGAGRYVFDAAYSEFGELSQVMLGEAPNQVLQTFYFEAGTRRLLNGVVDRQQGTPRKVQDVSYTYDPAGNVTRIADRPEAVAADAQCFRYDRLRRLTEAWTTTGTACGEPGGGLGGPAPYWLSYAYDAVGNRRGETIHATGAASATTASRTYTYPAPGKPRPHAVTSVSGGGGAAAAATYTYDGAGNVTSRPGPDGPQTLTWTPWGKLATVRSGSGTVANHYDAASNLVVTRDNQSITVHLDGTELRHDTVSRKTTGARYYTFGGGPVAVRTAGKVHWLIRDHHGTETMAVDAATSATTVRRSDPFGNQRGAQPAWPSANGFVGGSPSGGTGLTRLGAREYDPGTGRFLSVDPILDPADPQQLNAYAYANNSPATMSDPDGLAYFDDATGRRYSGSPKPSPATGGRVGAGLGAKAGGAVKRPAAKAAARVGKSSGVKAGAAVKRPSAGAARRLGAGVGTKALSVAGAPGLAGAGIFPRGSHEPTGQVGLGLFRLLVLGEPAVMHHEMTDWEIAAEAVGGAVEDTANFLWENATLFAGIAMLGCLFLPGINLVCIGAYGLAALATVKDGVDCFGGKGFEACVLFAADIFSLGLSGFAGGAVKLANQESKATAHAVFTTAEAFTTVVFTSLGVATAPTCPGVCRFEKGGFDFRSRVGSR